MRKIPTLYSDYQECILDLDIYGKIVATPQQSLSELTETLFEEFKRRKPLPTLEYKRYELSRLVDPNYRIAYNKELELQDNESLVELRNMASSFEAINFEDLTPLIPDVQEAFSYESNITDSVRKSIIDKYDLSTGEEFKPGIHQTELIVGSVQEDKNLVLSDEEIENLGVESDSIADINEDDITTTTESEEPVYELDEDIAVVDEDNYDNTEDIDDFENFSDEETDSDDDIEDFSDEESSLDDDDIEDFETEYELNDIEDFEGEDELSGTEDFENDIDSDDIEDFEDMDSSADGDISDFEDFDDTVEQESETQEEETDNDFGDFSDEDTSEGEDFEDFSDEGDSEGEDFGDFSDEDNSESDDFGDFSDEETSSEDDFGGFSEDEDSDNDEDFSDTESDEDDSGNDFEDFSEEEPDEDFEDFTDDSNEEDDDSKYDYSQDSESKSNESVDEDIDVDVGDMDIEFLDSTSDITKPTMSVKPGVVRHVETPVTPIQIYNEPKHEEVIDRSAEPTDIRAFLRKHPRCEYSFALKYFTKNQIDTAIKVGKVIKKGNILKI
jgi:hypothetical protein